MKFIFPTLALVGALTQFTPASLTAQSVDEQDSVATERARAQEKRQAEDAKRQGEDARRLAGFGRRQAEVAKEQAEFNKQQAEEVKAQVEAALRQVTELKEKFSSDEQREIAERAMKSARQAMEQVQQSLGSRLYAQGPKPAAPVQPAKPPTPPEPPETPKPAAKAWGFSHDGFSFASRRPSVRTLVVSPDTGDAKTLANIEEDLSVMWRILDKETERELGKDSGERALGISISSGDSRNPNAVLLDGFGALFTLSVRFPLVAPPKAKEEKKTDPASDTTWEKTRRELFGSPDGGKPVKSKYRGELRKPEMEYDAAKVETLKTTLLEALKNASNLRNVKPDEYISVAVLGGGSGGDMFVYDFNSNNNNNRSSYSVTTSGSGSVTATASSGNAPVKISADEMVIKGDGGRNSTLTLRVKKSDVDAFAKGSLTLEEFRNKAAINIY